MDPRYDWIVSFEDLRRIPPFIDVRLDHLNGVLLVSQVSSHEENLIVARSAQCQFCRNANVKQRQMHVSRLPILYHAQEHTSALHIPIIKLPGRRMVLHFGRRVVSDV
jgi:hypothetical protein